MFHRSLNVILLAMCASIAVLIYRTETRIAHYREGVMSIATPEETGQLRKRWQSELDLNEGKLAEMRRINAAIAERKGNESENHLSIRQKMAREVASSEFQSQVARTIIPQSEIYLKTLKTIGGVAKIDADSFLALFFAAAAKTSEVQAQSFRATLRQELASRGVDKGVALAVSVCGELQIRLSGIGQPLVSDQLTELSALLRGSGGSGPVSEYFSDAVLEKAKFSLNAAQFQTLTSFNQLLKAEFQEAEKRP